MTDLVTAESTGHVTVLRLRPRGRFPVLSRVVIEELERLLMEARDSGVRTVILTGEGPDFAAGADIRELQCMGPQEAYGFARLGQRVCRLLETGPWVSVAAVAGIALGGGTELALACDVRFCAPSARFGETGVSLGIMAGWGGTRRLPRLVGEAAARDLMLSGRHFGADEALRLGLVSAVVLEQSLMRHALDYADLISSHAPHAVRSAKQAINAARSLPPEEADEHEARLFADLFSSEETRSTLLAFTERAG